MFLGPINSLALGVIENLKNVAENAPTEVNCL